MKVITKYITLYIKSIKFIWKSCKFLTIAMIALIPIQALMPSATLYLTNIIINKVQENDIKQISLFVILWCVVFVLNNIMPPINVFIQGQLTDKLTYYLNFSVMKKAEEIQDLSHYEDAEFYNEIKLISSEASWRPVNLLVFGSSIISNSIIFISMVCMLASFQIWIAIVIFIAMIVQGWIAYKIQQQSFETLVSNTEDSRKLSYYSESVLNADYIKDIRLYSLHSFFQNKYKCTYEEIRKKVQKNRIKQFVGATIFLIVCAIFGAFCFNFVINSVIDNVYKLGVIMVFVSTIGYSIQSVTILVQDTSLLYDTLLYMEKVFCYLKIKDVGYEGQEEPPEDFSILKFNDLNFTYPNATKKTLHNISFFVKKGQKIAIVGENGAGKTTLVKLILRLYLLGENQILFDGQDAANMEINKYREKFSAVFQDFSKFDLSLTDNVVLSNLEQKNNEKKFNHALEQSGIDLNEMDINKEQILGKQFDNARDLSGGQWQRIALARAFFSDANIVILDEPTAAMDAKMEQYIYDRFNDLAKDKTVLFITHRLGAVRKADKILVLKDGKVNGFDTHEKLMEENKYYRDLYNIQADMYI